MAIPVCMCVFVATPDNKNRMKGQKEKENNSHERKKQS